MVEQLRQLIRLLASNSSDRTTLDELLEMIDDRKSWQNAHALFDRIRKKTLQIERTNVPSGLGYQYSFEEACVKMLSNLSGTHSYNAESPYYIVPMALAASCRL